MTRNAITLEEHFVTRDFLDAANRYRREPALPMQQLEQQLLELGAGRIAKMDEGGVAVQVLSLAAHGVNDLPPDEQVSVLRDVHGELASAIRAHPDRYAGFATPPLRRPEEAAKELERCIRDLGFKGALVNGTTDGKFLDAPEFMPFWEAAASLGIPVYLHPAPPPEPVHSAYYTGLPGETGYMLSIAGWGWHAELGLHALRLILSGLFDKLPALQVIIGHMGEGIPYALARTTSVFSRAKHLQRSVADIFKQHFHITTSGFFTRPPFDCARAVVGLERILYSVDYPFSATTQGQQFLSELGLTPGEMDSLTRGAAAKLLKL
jgi:hypothetical protein